MASRWRDNLLYVILATPGWMLLLGGLVVTALVLLVPPYLEIRELVWQRDLMRLQASRLAEQEQGYRAFLDDLKHDDPVLIERLAYHYLRQKPAGANLVNNQVYRNGQWSRSMFVRLDDLAATPPANQAPFAAEPFSNVDHWLYRPMPKVGPDYPPYRQLEHKVVKIATGPSRLVVLAAGLLAMGVGLVPVARRQTLSRKLPWAGKVTPLEAASAVGTETLKPAAGSAMTSAMSATPTNTPPPAAAAPAAAAREPVSAAAEPTAVATLEPPPVEAADAPLFASSGPAAPAAPPAGEPTELPTAEPVNSPAVSHGQSIAAPPDAAVDPDSRAE